MGPCGIDILHGPFPFYTPFNGGSTASKGGSNAYDDRIDQARKVNSSYEAVDLHIVRPDCNVYNRYGIRG